MARNLLESLIFGGVIGVISLVLFIEFRNRHRLNGSGFPKSKPPNIGFILLGMTIVGIAGAVLGWWSW